MKSSLPLFACLFVLALSVTLSFGQTPTAGSPQTAFQKILSEYYVIHAALANDTTVGVDKAAQNIVKLASGAHLTAISSAANALQGKNLEEARNQFFELSKPIIDELKRNPSTGTAAFAYRCNMAKKTWVQGTKEVRNPYYGKSMQKCGEPL